MEKAKTDTLASTHRAISEILRNYVADEDARLELDYKIFCILKKHTENLNPEDSLLRLIEGHYKIFCVNGNTGFRNESRIFYFIHLQNEEDYERKESSSA